MKIRAITLFLYLLFMRQGEGADPQGSDSRSSIGLRFNAEERVKPPLLPEPDDSFYYRVSSRGLERLETRLFDAVNPARVMSHNVLSRERDRELVRSSFVTGSLTYGLREIAVESVLVQNSRDWLKGLVEGVFGNTEEEEITIATDPSIQYSEEEWRKKAKLHNFTWGLRLLRWPEPYVYIGGRLGHHEGNEILTWHLRYYLKEFERQRVEALLSMPLPFTTYLSLGAVYTSGREFRELGHMYVGTVRLEKWLPDKRGAVFVGTEIYKKMDLIAGCFFAF